MTWSNNSVYTMASAEAWFLESYPYEDVVVLQTFDVAWSGWEGDTQGALITHNGQPDIVIVAAITSGIIPDLLEERIREYRRMADETEAALERYRAMGGLTGEDWASATRVRRRMLDVLDRGPDESEEDHRARLRLWKIPDHPGSVTFKEEKYSGVEIVTSETITTIDLSRRPALEEFVRHREKMETFGSDNVFADLGVPDPETHALKSRLVAKISDAVAGDVDRGAKLSGMPVEDFASLLRGRVRDVELSELERIAALVGA